MKKVELTDIILIGKDAIEEEIKAMSNLVATLGHSFAEAVYTIHRCSGRILVTGVGKSAIIGKKIVATFNSINIPAVFLHAADALHGDLGSLQSEDVVICLSKSGHTAEIVALIPQIKAKNNTIIAIVSKQDSFLAKHADTAIYVPVEKEADPLNLAPTVSTILQMAIGDALAICLMRLRNFQQQDFAVLHPGGMLGKRLTMTVGDLAHLEYPPTVYDKDAIEKVIVEISSKRLGATAVLDDAQRVCGIITDGDLRRMLQRGGDYRLCYAHQVMTGKPKIIDQNEKAGVALDMMRKHNITQLLVVEGSSANYLGVIHIHDLLREGF